MRVLATASAGTQRLLASECGDLGLRPRKVKAHGVELDLDWAGVARALVHLRVAQRVLVFLHQFPCDGAESLYDGARAVPWGDWLEPRQRIAVAATGRLPNPQRARRGGALTNHVFASQRIKDALCDQLREATGERPSVDLDRPDLRIVARFSGDGCSLWLDPAGAALHRRGYRQDAGDAPLRETLAAAIVRATGWPWQRERPFMDPMCGSGTLLIEAVSMALELAPGRSRDFAATRWRRQGSELGGLLRDAQAEAVTHAAQSARQGIQLDVVGQDLDPRMLDIARNNLKRAGVARWVQLRRADACHMPAPRPGTVLVSNLPYGERIGGPDVGLLYEALGRHWAGFQGCEAHLLVGNEHFERHFGLRWSDRLALTNGSLPAALHRYVL